MKNLLFLLYFTPCMTAAQNFHFAARLGLSNYNGDVHPAVFSLSQAKLVGSVGVQYDLSERFTARSYLSLGTIQGDDKRGTPAMQRRNLNFKSTIDDWEGSMQYSILNLNEHWWTPYIFAGIGVFHFNPYTTDTAGHKYYLQPLSTEGEGIIPGIKPYKLLQLSIPFGVGATYSLNEDTRLGVELGYRKTFTDYLDDVSGAYADQATLLTAKGPKAVELAYRGNEVQAGSYPPAGTLRGNANNKDSYYFVVITYTVRYFFDKYKQIAGILHGKKQKKVGCPASNQ